MEGADDSSPEDEECNYGNSCSDSGDNASEEASDESYHVPKVKNRYALLDDAE